MSLRLETRHVRHLLRLAGECRELRDAGDDPARHLLEGLADLTHSKVALRMTAATLTASSAPMIGDVEDFGWSTESDRDRVYGFVSQRPLADDPLTSALLKSDERLVTLTRGDALSSQAWARTEVRNDVHRPSGVDDSILSLFRDVSPGRVRVLAFKRAWGEPAFGAEEREIVHLAHGECGWALQPLPAVNPPLAAGWPPKERETFALLLTGATEEEIASTLGLAPPAVHVYVQEIQRRLGVTTRAEMVAAAFVRRD